VFVYVPQDTKATASTLNIGALCLLLFCRVRRPIDVNAVRDGIIREHLKHAEFM
jgi:hypothetical protein